MQSGRNKTKDLFREIVYLGPNLGR